MRKLLITGGSGFLGQNLAKRLKEDYQIILASRNEKNLLQVSRSLDVDFYPLDVTNLSAVNEAFSRIQPDYVIHAAATKFVDIAEKFPNECIDSNVIGSQNIARAAIHFNVKTVIGISTDKVTSPIANIYGFSKAIMEKLFVLQNSISDTRFLCVRYGNVAWSTGSVLPLWYEMTKKDCRVVTTGPQMYRFFFSIEAAVDLVYTALRNSELLAGKVLSMPMKGSIMSRMLEVWCQEFEVSWTSGESRPGDRKFELLIGQNELTTTRRIILDSKSYLLIDPTNKFRGLTIDGGCLEAEYTSENAPQLDLEEIRALIRNSPVEFRV